VKRGRAISASVSPLIRLPFDKRYSYRGKMPSVKKTARTKTITISLPITMGREIQRVAAAEGRTVSELLRETFRQYQARRRFRALAAKGQRQARRLGLKAEDFGGPFAE
jgi:Ribbon-helix-helix protein, copG family